MSEFTPLQETEVYATLEEVFETILGHFEGRYSTMSGDYYGEVSIRRTKPEETK